MNRTLLLACSLLCAAGTSAQSEATYRVTFESTWSAATHPDGFPANAHYSSLVGATHGAAAALWRPGETASVGMEVMAETGSTGPLLSEVQSLRMAGADITALQGAVLSVSPGTVSMDLRVTDREPLVTLVTMLAPSPDWFVGVSGLDLRTGSGWSQTVTIPLFVYDAGTDSGTAYTSADVDTQPRDPIARIVAAPFATGGTAVPVGSLTFERTGTTAEADAPLGDVVGLPYPNPTTGDASLRVSLRQSEGATVHLVDVLGRTVWSAPLPSAPAAEIRLPASRLAAGTYLVRVENGQGVLVRRLTVR